MTLVDIKPIKYARNIILKSDKPIQEWAIDLNVSRQTIYDWLNKDVNIRKKNVYRIANLANQEITIIKNSVKVDIEKRKKKEDSPMDTRDQIIKSQEMNISLLTEKISILENDLISKPPPEFNWTESSAEKFAVELNADSTFQEIANELHIKSEQWNYLFDNINQPLGISRKGIVREVNQMYVEQFGYNRNDLIGKPIMEFVHPEEHERLKKAIVSDNSNYIWRIRKKNGHYCRVRVQRQAFGDPDDGFSVSLMECIDGDCANID